MVDLVTAALSGVGVLIVLGIIYFVYSKWFSTPDHREAREETKEEIQLEGENVSNAERVGLFQRTRAQPATTKAFYLSIIVFVLLVLVAAYTVLKSGTPKEMAYASEMQQVVFGTVIATGVVWFVRRQDRKAGKLRIIFENESSTSKDIPFDWNTAQPVSAMNEGEEVCLAPAYKKNRLLGLFWRVDLVADNPDLRDIDKTLPEDRNLYEIPLDESATWDHQEQTVTVRAKREEPVKDPKRAATYQLVPSDRRSKGEIDQLEDDIAELESEVDHLERMHAIKDEQIDSLEETLANIDPDSDKAFQDAMEKVLKVVDVLNGNHPSRPDGDGTGYDFGDRAKFNGASSDGESEEATN